MSWFGTDIKLDGRKLVAFARDISYITPNQYTNLMRPQKISKFPDALEDPGLEYSGIFEDAWISDIAYVVLKAPPDGERTLHLIGLIPDIGGTPFNSTLTIRVNGQVVYKGEHGKGDVKISVPLDKSIFNGGLSTKIQIESSSLQRLPNGDGRPVSMRLNSLAYTTK